MPYRFCLTRPHSVPLPLALAWYQPTAWLATWFGVGLLRPAAGTFGSLAAIPFALVLVWVGGTDWLLAAAAALFIIGWWSSARFAEVSGQGDPSSVVIDEVAGQWLVLALVPVTPLAWLLGFLFFRIFDITKPFPIGWCDRNLPGGLGIMADDLLAALMGLAVVRGILWLIY
ncbi:MAG: phosphatidylglycerophosphatase A [Candidatus Pacebacteria bacterium]|nr:phosphatidylglycerophosphatase A [Candidatus Paceibacterota bacterium]